MKPIQFARSHFFAGLLVITPLVVITWLLSFVLKLFWNLYIWLPRQWQPEIFIEDGALPSLLRATLVVVLALLIAVGVSFLGWMSKQYVGGKVLEWLGELIQRIPVIRGVYSALDQLMKTLAAGGGKQFNRVVYMEYPRKGVWTLAFVTGEARGIISSEEKYLHVYVPTTPNPTSGFYLIVPEAEVRESHLKVEDAFKVILSLGIAHGTGAGQGAGSTKVMGAKVSL